MTEESKSNTLVAGRLGFLPQQIYLSFHLTIFLKLHVKPQWDSTRIAREDMVSERKQFCMPKG